MYSDPQTLTIGGTAVVLPRTSSGVNSGVFKTQDGNKIFQISHAYGKRVRRVVRLDFQKISPDPLLTNVNKVVSGSWYLVCDAPLQGFTATELKEGADALSDWTADGTGTSNNLVRLIGGES